MHFCRYFRFRCILLHFALCNNERKLIDSFAVVLKLNRITAINQGCICLMCYATPLLFLSFHADKIKFLLLIAQWISVMKLHSVTNRVLRKNWCTLIYLEGSWMLVVLRIAHSNLLRSISTKYIVAFSPRKRIHLSDRIYYVKAQF